MSGMVERVARIFDEGAYLPEGAAGILMPRKVRRSDAEALARKVIAAMREPTKGMVYAAYNLPGDPGFCDEPGEPNTPEEYWEAMIDAALEGK